MSPSQEWQRARKPKQKALRRQEILDAAKRLFATKSYDEVSLNGIAREAGMSKPNIYRYFSSREEIFLHIFGEEQDRFFDHLLLALEGLGGSSTVDDIVELWIRTSEQSPDLMALLPQLGTSLEENSSVEQLIPFKKRGFQRIGQLATRLHHLHPRLSLETWGEVCHSAVAITAGLWPLCTNSENVRKAMTHPEVNLEPWDFCKKASFALGSLIRGAPS